MKLKGELDFGKDCDSIRCFATIERGYLRLYYDNRYYHLDCIDQPREYKNYDVVYRSMFYSEHKEKRNCVITYKTAWGYMYKFVTYMSYVNKALFWWQKKVYGAASNNKTDRDVLELFLERIPKTKIERL